MKLSKTARIVLVATLFVTGATSLLILSKMDGCATGQTKEVGTDVLEPVLNQSQQIRFLEGFYSCNPVERNDTVYYNHPGMDEDVLRQVRAVPGDEMTFEGCNIEINGQTLRNSDGEEYCFQGKRKALLDLYTGEINGYLILTQQSTGGFDSTRFGLVSKQSFTGKAVEKNSLF